MTLTKLELITLHRHLNKFKEYLLKQGLSHDSFKEYENLKVGPGHLHKSKTEHKRAIFALAAQLSKAIESPHFQRPEIMASQKQEVIVQLKVEDLKAFLQQYPAFSVDPNKLELKPILSVRKV